MTRHLKSIVSMHPDALSALIQLGYRIRANRVAQGWTVKEMAERLFCSVNTYRAIEAGKPSASIGVMVNVLWLFGQIDTLDCVAPAPIIGMNARRARKSKSQLGAGMIVEAERDF